MSVLFVIGGHTGVCSIEIKFSGEFILFKGKNSPFLWKLQDSPAGEKGKTLRSTHVNRYRNNLQWQGINPDSKNVKSHPIMREFITETREAMLGLLRESDHFMDMARPEGATLYWKLTIRPLIISLKNASVMPFCDSWHLLPCQTMLDIVPVAEGTRFQWLLRSLTSSWHRHVTGCLPEANGLMT